MDKNSPDSHYGNNELYEKWMKNTPLYRGQVVFTTEAPMGNVAQIPDNNKYILSQRTIAFVPKKELNDDFLAVLLSTRKVQLRLKSLSTGGTATGISQKSLKFLNVMLPNTDEQTKIQLLNHKVTKLLSLQQKKLEQLKLLKKAMLQQLFVSDKNNLVPNIRFKGFMYPWKQQKLGDVGKTQSGIGFPNKEQGGQQGIPFFKVSDMNNNENEFEMKDANNYVTETQITNRKWKPISEVPALIFAKVGAALMLNRKRLVNVPFLIDNNTMAYIFSKEWNPHFGKNLFDTLNLPRYAQTGALPSFNGSDIENIEVMLPSLKEQHVISQFFKNINYLITLHQRKIHTLSNLKKFCLQKMFI
ncbi:MAG TPA: restriction endonuclease subunit S [Limosilactobacillus coleohominis]|nr:restriction endonuclease subunit S [Limosilactobacillus coleohominis]